MSHSTDNGVPEEAISVHTDKEGNEEVHILFDKLPRFDTSKCRHNWICDEGTEGEGMCHWQCTNPRCGLGKYQAQSPA